MLVIVTATLAACGTTANSQAPHIDNVGFRSGDCNLVSDDDVNATVGPGRFTKVVVNDSGCFWQENMVFGTVGVGMGISTWWYRGSDLDVERMLESKAGRSMSDITLGGHSGFLASDATTCSVYVSKDSDVVAWSIQSVNPAALPELCGVVRRLAQLTQDRVD